MTVGPDKPPLRMLHTQTRRKALAEQQQSGARSSHLTFALSGAPPERKIKDAPLFGASALERVVRHQPLHPLTKTSITLATIAYSAQIRTGIVIVRRPAFADALSCFSHSPRMSDRSC